MEFSHVTVLLHEAVAALAIKPQGIYLDGTVGGAGHSMLIARQLKSGKLIALDKDPAAVRVAAERLADLPAQVVRADFRNIAPVLDELNILALDGILLDLGVSSYQLDEAERGFSYNAEARLDMRMSGEGLSAWEVVNSFEPQRIAKILWEYGEEKFSRRIADLIAKRRLSAPIDTTAQLAALIKEAIPAPARRTGGNPAKRSFQAIRIAVNGELDGLSAMLEPAFERLKVGGRMAIITFHSLEDRIVKQQFAQWCRGCVCPPDCPVCICGRTPRAKLVTRKPVLPSESEQQENRRSHSARLRAVEKLA